MRTDHRAFTLVEMLVVLAIIFLLITTVIVSMKGVRLAANRTESLNALRGMAMAYNAYHTDHRGQLLPGCVAADKLSTLGLEAELESGYQLTACAGSVCDASSYVWRLLPYMNYDWPVLMTDYGVRSLTEHFANTELTIDPGSAGACYGMGSADWSNGKLGIGAVPAFGLNSIFLGGDNIHGGSDFTDNNPWDPVDPNAVIATTHYAKVKNPAKIILFGSTRYYDQSEFENTPSANVEYGYVELRPPFLWHSDDQEWKNQWYLKAGAPNAITIDSQYFGNGGGVPIGRWGEDRVPVANVDGSTLVEELGKLGPSEVAKDQMTDVGKGTFMARWCPFTFDPTR